MKYNIDLVKEKLNEEKTLSEVCKELNYPYKQIHRYIKKEDVNYKKRKKLTKEDVFIIKSAIYDRYKKGESLKSLSEEFKIDRGSIKKIFIKENLSLVQECKIRCKDINHDFFEKIDSELKSYLLGFFTADGTINRRGNSISVLIQERDIEILDLFKEAFNDKKDFYKYKKKKETHQNRLKFVLNSERNKKNILNKGINYNKTEFLFNLPNEYVEEPFIKDFIRGYFDGNGSIILPSKKSRVTKFKITSTNLDFLLFCKNIFVNLGCSFVKIENYQHLKAKTLYIQNKKSIQIVFNYLYNNDKCLYKLNRKYEKLKRVALSLSD